jgi:hypothetical protein
MAIWPYAAQLWGTASTSNIESLELFQSTAFRMIVDTILLVPTEYGNPKSSPNIQQLKKKSVTTALSTARASVNTQTT